MTKTAYICVLAFIVVVASMVVMMMERDWQGRVYRAIPVNNKPLNWLERSWAARVVYESESASWSCWTDRKKDWWGVDGLTYRMAWGSIQAHTTDMSRPIRFDGLFVDGVGQVTEPGEWWVLTRQALNRLAGATRAKNEARQLAAKLRAQQDKETRPLRLRAAMERVRDTH